MLLMHKPDTKATKRMSKTAIRIIAEFFSAYTMQAISKKTLLEFQNELLSRTKRNIRNGEPLSPAYINRIFDELRAMFGYAVANGDLDESALKHFKGLKLKGMIKRLRLPQCR